MFDLITRNFEHHFDNMLKKFDEEFASLKENSVGFVEKENCFELSIPVGDEIEISDVKIRVEDTLTYPVLSVAYAIRTKNSQSTYAFEETLPEKADSKTLKAVLNDNVIFITVDKIKEDVKKTNSIPIERA